MIDIHCHILPHIDDGAASLDEALEMARMAVFTGVTDIVATPHFQGDFDFLEMKEDIAYRFKELTDALERWHVPLKLHQGAEVLCLPQTPELAEAGVLPTLGNTKYVLTEFYFNESFSFMDDCLQQIAKFGYIPVVAHPERYEAVHRDAQRLWRWADQGFVLQVNKGSILGNLGRHAEESAHELLGMGLAHLFASDAHGCDVRTTHMDSLRRWADEFCEPECAHILMTENPRRVLQGLPMAEMMELPDEDEDDFDYPDW